LLRAPFAGTIIAYNVAEGEVVDSERELLTVADLSTVWVQADLYEKDLAAVRSGHEVSVVVDAYPDATFAGRITYVSDMIDPQTRTARVRCEVPNPIQRLKLSMFATIHIPTSDTRDMLMVPVEAVQQIDDVSIVFVVQDEYEFQAREVQIGIQQEEWVEIIAGLNADERIVTQGAFMLKSELKKQELETEEDE